MTKSAYPSGWRVVSFGDLAESISERVDDPKAAGVEIYVGLEHLDPDTTKISRFGTPEDVESTKLRFYPGDVIYARRRAYQRKLGVSEMEGICSAHALVLRARPEVCLPEFLPYFLQSDQFHERALSISVGSLSPTINWKTLVVQEFVLPPIAEQQRIVALLNQVDELISSCELAQDHLIKLQLCKFEELVNDSEYLVSPLCDIADIYRGFSFSGTDYVSAGGINFLTLASVERGGGYKPNKLKSIEADVKDKHKVVEGDLLVANTDLTPARQFIGRPFLVPKNLGVCAFSHHLTRVLPSDRSLNEWLYWELQSAQARRVISSSSRGSTVIMLDNKKFNSLNMRIPDASSRQSILDVMQAFDTLKTKLVMERESGAMLRKSILNSILNGSTNV
jgi:type I restriction enzyme, S subunit